jgi:hypothetical protein
MIELYFSILGDWAVEAINSYRRHQGVLNVLVLAYGILLAIAHNNVRKVETALVKETGEPDLGRLRTHLEAKPLSREAEATIRQSLTLPIVASPWHFSFHRYSIENALRVLEKKHSRGRRQ